MFVISVVFIQELQLLDVSELRSWYGFTLYSVHVMLYFEAVAVIMCLIWGQLEQPYGITSEVCKALHLTWQVRQLLSQPWECLFSSMSQQIVCVQFLFYMFYFMKLSHCIQISILRVHILEYRLHWEKKHLIQLATNLSIAMSTQELTKRGLFFKPCSQICLCSQHKDICFCLM